MSNISAQKAKTVQIAHILYKTSKTGSATEILSRNLLSQSKALSMIITFIQIIWNLGQDIQ